MQKCATSRIVSNGGGPFTFWSTGIKGGQPSAACSDQFVICFANKIIQNDADLHSEFIVNSLAVTSILASRILFSFTS